jgi:hypothetical protein
MEVLWTAVSYLIFASGVALAAYVMIYWIGSARH